MKEKELQGGAFSIRRGKKKGNLCVLSPSRNDGLRGGVVLFLLMVSILAGFSYGGGRWLEISGVFICLSCGEGSPSLPVGVSPLWLISDR